MTLYDKLKIMDNKELGRLHDEMNNVKDENYTAEIKLIVNQHSTYPEAVVCLTMNELMCRLQDLGFKI